MHTHDPTGTAVCVHGLTVVEQYRRTGIASALLKEYILRLQDNPAVGINHADKILLICHEDLIPLYMKAGFALQGKSSVVHGPKAWFEMRIELKAFDHAILPSSEGDIPPGVLAALTNPSRMRSVGRLLSSFPSAQHVVTASRENAFDILCPRMGCGSIILKAGVAKLQRAPSIDVCVPPLPLSTHKLIFSTARASGTQSTSATCTFTFATCRNRLVACHTIPDGI